MTHDIISCPKVIEGHEMQTSSPNAYFFSNNLGFKGSKILGFRISGVKKLGIWDLRGKKFWDVGF